MGLDDVFGHLPGLAALGGDELKKILGLVDALWDEKDRIIQVVKFVSEHREALGTVMRFVEDHGDDLVRLGAELPELLGRVGEGITLAGSSAQKAAILLTGEDGSIDVDGLVGRAASALERGRGQLGLAMTVLERLADQVDGVKIPTVAPKFSEVMGFRVVTGLDFGESGLVDNAAERIREGARNMAGLAGDVGAVADHFRELGGRLRDLGSDLSAVGSQLESSGTTLAAAGALTSPAPKPTVKKAVAAKKTVAAKRTVAAKKTVAAKRTVAAKKATPTEKPVAARRATPTKKATPAKKTVVAEKAPARRPSTGSVE